MRGTGITIAWAIAGCGAQLPALRLPELDPTPVVESSRPTLEPTGRADAVPIDPYAAEPAERATSTPSIAAADPTKPTLRGLDYNHVLSDVDFGDPSTVTAMHVLVRLPRRLPSHINHRVAEVDGVQHIEIRVGPGPRVTDEERADALIATPSYDIEQPRLRAAALAATSGARTDRERSDALVAYVYETIQYKISDETVASTILADAVGDCSEMSLLFVALARAVGVPARRVSGFAPTLIDGQQALGLHAWAEVALDDHWVAVDPTWNEPTADATHLMLYEGELHVGAPYATINQIGVAVVDITRDNRLAGREDIHELVDQVPLRLRELR